MGLINWPGNKGTQPVCAPIIWLMEVTVSDWNQVNHSESCVRRTPDQLFCSSCNCVSVAAGRVTILLLCTICILHFLVLLLDSLWLFLY